MNKFRCEVAADLVERLNAVGLSAGDNFFMSFKRYCFSITSVSSLWGLEPEMSMQMIIHTVSELDK